MTISEYGVMVTYRKSNGFPFTRCLLFVMLSVLCYLCFILCYFSSSRFTV